MRPDAVEVKLTIIEVCWAVMLGVWRRISGWKNGLNAEKHTDKKSDWATDIDGVRAEMALAKWLGVYYEPRNMDFKGPDVGRECQVRSTTRDNGCLIVRPNDAKTQKHKFVLAITPPGLSVWLVGWRFGDECRKDEFRHKDEYGRDDGWWLKQGALASMETFPVPRQKSLFAA
jgi:hypothetical protein